MAHQARGLGRARGYGTCGLGRILNSADARRSRDGAAVRAPNP